MNDQVNEDKNVGTTVEDPKTEQGVMRSLDIEVAAKVMGFRWFHCVAGTGVERNQFCSEDQGQIWRSLGWKMTEIPGPPPPAQFNDDSAAHRYSTDIAAAMEVIGKLRADKWIPTMVTVGPKWMVELFRVGKTPQFNTRA